MQEINPKYNPMNWTVLINGKPNTEIIPSNIIDLIASEIETQLCESLNLPTNKTEETT